eukprot:scaffold6360_cov66-Phaeocystis_antarctica.AAC.4
MMRVLLMSSLSISASTPCTREPDGMPSTTSPILSCSAPSTMSGVAAAPSSVSCARSAASHSAGGDCSVSRSTPTT